MNEKAFENLMEVRDEARLMIENLAKVRGERYSRIVKALLLSSNVMEINAVTASIGNLPDEVRRPIGDAMCSAVYGVLTNLAAAAEISEEEMQSATKDAGAMEASISGLMKTAVVSGMEGSSFGDRGAQ